MDPNTKDRLADRNIWARGLYMLLFAIIYAVTETLITLLIIFQFIAALFTGRTNDALLKLGANMSTFVYQILQYVTFNSETVPFPFSDWPDVEPGTSSPWTRGLTPSKGSDPNSETPSEGSDPIPDASEGSDPNSSSEPKTNEPNV